MAGGGASLLIIEESCVEGAVQSTACSVVFSRLPIFPFPLLLYCIPPPSTTNTALIAHSPRQRWKQVEAAREGGDGGVLRVIAYAVVIEIGMMDR